MPASRLVWLLGAARSGTTWLGNMLNSFPSSLYCHEPLLRPEDDAIAPFLRQIRSAGQLSEADRAIVLDYWSRAYHATRRPPFFPKDYTRWPASVVWTAWLAVSATGRGTRWFRDWFSPLPEARFDLVVKQGGLALHGAEFMGALAPAAVIVIVRHPCGVIASVRRGQRLGLMARPARSAWIASNLPAAQESGFDQRQLETMTDTEFESMKWVVETGKYQRLAEAHPNGHIVVYRELYNEPLAVVTSLATALNWDVTEQTRRFIRATTKPNASRLSSWLVSGHPYFSVYRPSRESVGAWAHELTKREQEEILAVARPLVQRHWPDSLPIPG